MKRKQRGENSALETALQPGMVTFSVKPARGCYAIVTRLTLWKAEPGKLEEPFEWSMRSFRFDAMIQGECPTSVCRAGVAGCVFWDEDVAVP